MSNTKPCYDALYQRRYWQDHPEKQEEWRVRAEIKHLRSLGYSVTKKAAIDEATAARRAYYRQWRAKNRERVSAYNRRYNERHPEYREIRREYARKRRAEDPEGMREYGRRWRAANADRVNAYKREWLENHPGYYKNRKAETRIQETTQPEPAEQQNMKEEGEA